MAYGHVCLQLGDPPATYEASVGAANKLFLEQVSMTLLARQGILPLDDDERDDPTDPKTHGRS